MKSKFSFQVYGVEQLSTLEPNTWNLVRREIITTPKALHLILFTSQELQSWRRCETAEHKGPPLYSIPSHSNPINFTTTLW